MADTPDLSDLPDLPDLQGLLADTDAEIASRRREALATMRENDVLSFPSDLPLLSAFDDILLCFAFGGQLRNYYRYGTYTTCAAQREKFWFAMWNGLVSGGDINAETIDPRELERRKKVQAFYRKRMYEQKLSGSSEDVWNERKTMLHRPFRE